MSLSQLQHQRRGETGGIPGWGRRRWSRGCCQDEALLKAATSCPRCWRPSGWRARQAVCVVVAAAVAVWLTRALRLRGQVEVVAANRRKQPRAERPGRATCAALASVLTVRPRLGRQQARSVSPWLLLERTDCAGWALERPMLTRHTTVAAFRKAALVHLLHPLCGHAAGM
jgi:hypothetical protein